MKADLIEKGLRRTVGTDEFEPNGTFESRPDREGIKTARLLRAFVRPSGLKADLIEKGLRRSSCSKTGRPSESFESSPDREGIKTSACAVTGICRLCLKADLIEKGLRHRNMNHYSFHRRLKADLIEKGLRHLAAARHVDVLRFESRPDREGIKTRRALGYGSGGVV